MTGYLSDFIVCCVFSNVGYILEPFISVEIIVKCCV